MADLRTPAEIRYDAERSGAAYVKSDPWLPILEITDDPTNNGQLHDDEQAVAGWIDTRAPAAPAIEITRIYHDLAHLGDACEDPDAGPLAYTDYALGSDDTRAEISIQADGSCEPDVFLCGHEAIPLSHFLGALANLRRLLADERVQ